MTRREWALRFEINPFVLSHALVWHAVQRGLESGRHRIAWLKREPQPTETERKVHSLRFIWKSESRHRVVKRFAVRTGDRLYKKIQSAIRFSRNLRPKTTLAAFKPVCPAHKITQNAAHNFWQCRARDEPRQPVSRPFNSAGLNGPGSLMRLRASSTFPQTFHSNTPRTRPSRR